MISYGEKDKLNTDVQMGAARKKGGLTDACPTADWQMNG